MEPVSLLLKLNNVPSGRVVISGENLEGKHEIVIENMQVVMNVDMLEKLWAKRKIEELEGYLDKSNPRRLKALKDEIISISEAYGIISPLTSFVAIYERENKITGIPKTIVVPVNAPINTIAYNMEEDILFSSSYDVDQSPIMESKSKLINLDFMILNDENNFLNLVESKSNLKLSRKIDKAEVSGLKELAAMQNSDGTFGDGKNKDVDIALETAKAIIKFTSSSKDILVFRKQLRKAVNYLTSQDLTLNKDESLIKLIYIALELCKLRKVLKSNDELSSHIENLKVKLSDEVFKDKVFKYAQKGSMADLKFLAEGIVAIL